MHTVTLNHAALTWMQRMAIESACRCELHRAHGKTVVVLFDDWREGQIYRAINWFLDNQQDTELPETVTRFDFAREWATH